MFWNNFFLGGFYPVTFSHQDDDFEAFSPEEEKLLAEGVLKVQSSQDVMKKLDYCSKMDRSVENASSVS